MGAKDVFVNLLGAICLIALSPSFSCLPSVLIVSHFGEAFGAEEFFVLRPCQYVLGRFWLGGGALCPCGRTVSSTAFGHVQTSIIIPCWMQSLLLQLYRIILNPLICFFPLAIKSVQHVVSRCNPGGARVCEMRVSDFLCYIYREAGHIGKQAECVILCLYHDYRLRQKQGRAESWVLLFVGHQKYK